MRISRIGFHLLAVIALFAAPARGQTVYATLVSRRDPYAVLASFDAAAPTTLNTIGTIKEVNGSQLTGIVAIEQRPATGQLYALEFTASHQARLLIINTTTAMATPVGPAVTLNLRGRNSTAFGFDPITDEAWVVDATGRINRLNPNSGTLLATGAALAYIPTDPWVGQTPFVSSVAFTQGIVGAPVAYGLDLTAGTLVTLSSSATATGAVRTVGPLGINLNPTSTSQSALPLISMGIGYQAASGTTIYLLRSEFIPPFSTKSDWYRVDPATGVATLLSTAPTGETSDIAVTSNVVSGVRPGAVASASLAPNPSSGETTWHVVLTRAGSATLAVFDATGRQVYAQAATYLAAGPHALHWTASGKAPGLYILRLMVDGVPAASERLLVQ